MANSLREVKMRIASTESTAQITKAMHMVSQSKVRRAETVYKGYKDFMERISDMVSLVVSKAALEASHPLLVKREIKKECYFLVTSDRGLAGAYNSSIFKALEEKVKDKNKDDFYCVVVGKQGYSYVKRKGYNMIQDSQILVRDDVMFIDISSIAKQVVSLYLEGKIDSITMIYNHYINSLTQEVKIDDLLPITNLKKETKEEVDYVYESGIEKTLDTVLPIYVEDVIYGIILDAKTSEHTARMNAMRNATDNATEVIAKLQLLYNRARQTVITNELIDIIGGANAIGGKD